MYFKAKFIIAPAEKNIYLLNICFDSVIGKEIVLFKNHQFEIERDCNGNFSDLSYVNQCINTFDIEQIFIELLTKIISENDELVLFSSNGNKEILSFTDLHEFLS